MNPLSLQESGPFLIFFLRIQLKVRITIDFDHYMFLWTVKIDNE